MAYYCCILNIILFVYDVTSVYYLAKGRASPSPAARKPNPTKPSALKGAGATIAKTLTAEEIIKTESPEPVLAQTLPLQPALPPEEKEDGQYIISYIHDLSLHLLRIVA